MRDAAGKDLGPGSQKVFRSRASYAASRTRDDGALAASARVKYSFRDVNVLDCERRITAQVASRDEKRSHTHMYTQKLLQSSRRPDIKKIHALQFTLINLCPNSQIKH